VLGRPVFAIHQQRDQVSFRPLGQDVIDLARLHCHVVIGIDPKRRMFLVDLWRQQTSSNVWIEAWCDLVTKWKPALSLTLGSATQFNGGSRCV